MKHARLSRKSGQTMTELIIIISILSIGSILIIGLFGQQVKTAFTRMGGGIVGRTVARDTSTDEEMLEESGHRGTMDDFDERVGQGG